MFLFILSLVALAVAVGAVILGHAAQRKDPDMNHGARALGIGVGVVCLLVALGLFLTDTMVSVGTRNVGVVTRFGKPVGYLSNGLSFVAPWDDVTELDNSVQTDTYASESYDGKQQGGANGTGIHVRVARGATAQVNASVRWQTRQSKVDYLFRNFRTDGAITDNLVLRDLQAAMNVVFATYDPLGLDVNGNSTNRSQAELAASVLTIMRADIAQQNEGAINIESVIIPILHLDQDTQNRISEIQQQIALTRVAVQQKQTALAQAQANEALAASVSKDPNVLVAQCLQVTQAALSKGESLPAGWNCLSGGSIGLTVPAK